jgi:MFS family permease
MLDPFIYNEKVRLLAPAGLRNTTLSFITIMALLVALVAQPLIGQWSDRTRSRWGKRAPYLTAGVVGVSFALALVIVADNLWLLIIAAMLVSTFSNTTQAAWQALIPDQVPEFQRGKAAGIKVVLELMGAVAGIAVVGFILSRGNLWGTPLIAIALFFVILLITLSTLRRSPAPTETIGQAGFQNPFSSLMTTIKQAPPAFSWWMLNRFLFWSSAISIRTFLLNYLEDVLGLSPAYAQSLSSRLLVVLGLGVFVLALPAGAVADRIGRRPILVTAGLLAATGAIFFIIWRDLNLLFIGGGLIALAAGIFASASWALATDLVPDTKGALYLGLANGATVVGSIGGRLGGPLIDGLNRLMGTVTLGYLVVFGIAALFFVGSSVVVLKISEVDQTLNSDDL